MAAGVGKTYRMLQEAQAEASPAATSCRLPRAAPARRDRRPGRGLEVVPRRRVTYRDASSRSWTSRGPRRAPELCLIDELAHTNAPGVEHAKRYEDVQDVLEAGIDVYSTVNVQHLESLNDQVAELTGVASARRCPTRPREADEVVLSTSRPRR